MTSLDKLSGSSLWPPNKYSSGHDLLRDLYGGFEEDGIVADVVALLYLLVRDKLGVAESQHAFIHGVATAAPSTPSGSGSPQSGNLQ